MDRIEELLSEFTDLHTAVISHGYSIEDDEWQQASDKGQQIINGWQGMVAALESVEWVDVAYCTAPCCPWCEHSEREDHAPDCQRQAALTHAQGIAE